MTVYQLIKFKNIVEKKKMTTESNSKSTYLILFIVHDTFLE